MMKLPVKVTNVLVVVSTLTALGACKPSAKNNNSNNTSPTQGFSIAPVGVSGTEIQVAGTAFPARVQFKMSGTTDPSSFALALVERPANTTIEGRASLNPVLLWTPSASQPQAYVQFVIRDLKRCESATGNRAGCNLVDGQISPSSPIQPYDKLSTRYLLRFTGDSRVLQATNNAVVPGTQVIPGANNGIGNAVINTIGNQVLSGAGRVATTYVANGFSTNGMGWQQILQSAFGIPQATTPGATTGTVGTSVATGTTGNGAW